MWHIKHDKWVEEEVLRAYSGKLAEVKWPTMGVPLTKLNDILRVGAAKETKAKTAVEDSQSAAEAAESEEQAKKRRKLILSQNLLVEEPGFGPVGGGAVSSASSHGTSKQTVLIPVLLKKYLVDDWTNVSVETCVPPPGRIAEGQSAPALVAPYTKLLRLPRPFSVSAIIAMFLEHKRTGILGAAAAAPDESAAALFQSYLDTLTGLRSYFNGALPTVLLYRQERAQLELLRERLRSHNQTAAAQVQFAPANVYGVEHLVRLMVKLPGFLNGVQLESQAEQSKVGGCGLVWFGVVWCGLVLIHILYVVDGACCHLVPYLVWYFVHVACTESQ
jgi:hypothetical protein